MNQQAWVPIPAVLYWLWLVPLFFGGCFTFVYHREKRRLSNGIWFNLFLYTFLPVLAMTILGTDNHPLIIASVAIFVVFIMLVGFMFALQALLLLWNAWIVWKRESHSLANMLTLVLGIAILILPFFDNWLTEHLPAAAASYIVLTSNMILFYVLFWFYNYLTMLVLYQFNHPKYNQDYVIVLGAGLLNGDRVSPLLAQRIDRGLAFYKKQIKKTGKVAKMIFSGGQGGDEKLPEGTAMLGYALKQGLPEIDGLAETESKNTYQNMLYSKKLIEKEKTDNPKTIFVTNGYHTFRAGMVAKQAGLKADGIGAHTARFFLPNAIIREYIAIFMRNKYWHAAAIVLIAILSGVLTWIEYRYGGK
ncbi:YdcF family protein [Companilactobacillus nodensis]|uniref:Integral membrane protein n=1 Tax=Companilactobacillus nodensis DSM 19682 = JCM 14932 = NBRC 107160 TaxID=1423775 RepID=A0A0R1KMF0_9LACO|nr:YdcF family protein [Companilactobacillus nodensis]KRK81298.1 integral membrane protein [Companilactobacillus nodensis DSM 19682 = JCM 14932 = NBRC 107160]